MRRKNQESKVLTMSREQIEAMLVDIAEELDHDVCKAVFTDPEDEDGAKDTIDTLVGIVQEHLGKQR
jgi:molecular chaperone GrpE (heat shock protein)